MSAKSTASTDVALLRGINVGGKHKMPMKDLVEVCTGCKCADVRTYIQSGNVVFTAQASAVKKLAAELEKQLELRFGFAVPVVVRDREQMAHVVRSNPFLKAGKPEKTLHVSFLASEPSAEAIAGLDPNRSPGDEFRVVGSEIYFHFPNGAGNTKLTSAYLDSRLKTVGTARNWATVLQLAAMMEG